MAHAKEDRINKFSYQMSIVDEQNVDRPKTNKDN